MRPEGGLEEAWRRPGGGLEEAWRRPGGGLEEAWRRPGGGLEEAVTRTGREEAWRDELPPPPERQSLRGCPTLGSSMAR
ncbi:Serine/threonine-protein kinase TAO1 [Frankliniella fusca]|uniref:Serine/threonine-protein kinase TAO1 n=1 Tax=Frankliniella fusca TaxID=407009 RepID=A0AAE1H1K9_9NEOP|nr:Serine/threonine-protein kinase TAO1 [Frankliniella fusca]